MYCCNFHICRENTEEEEKGEKTNTSSSLLLSLLKWSSLLKTLLWWTRSLIMMKTKSLENWCQENNHHLIVSKIKKLIVDFTMKQGRSYTPIVLYHIYNIILYVSNFTATAPARWCTACIAHTTALICTLLLVCPTDTKHSSNTGIEVHLSNTEI